MLLCGPDAFPGSGGNSSMPLAGESWLPCHSDLRRLVVYPRQNDVEFAAESKSRAEGIRRCEAIILGHPSAGAPDSN